MKKRFKNGITAIFSVLAACIMMVPMPVMASGFDMEGDATENRQAADSTDVKILDTMPIIYMDPDLNAALAVMNMEIEDDPVDLDNTTVSSGTVLTYVIAYRNTNETAETVHLQIPVPDTYPLRSAYRGGTQQGTLVTWSDILVEPDETVTRYITCDTPKATGMIPNTGLVMISDNQNMQTNTVNVAVSAPAVMENVPTPINIVPPEEVPEEDTGVLGAFRRALKAAEDSPAVLGMRRAIQTGDVPYIMVRVLFLAAICTAVSCLIVLLVKKRKEAR